MSWDTTVSKRCLSRMERSTRSLSVVIMRRRSSLAFLSRWYSPYTMWMNNANMKRQRGSVNATSANRNPGVA